MLSRDKRGSRDIQRFLFHYWTPVWFEGFARDQVYLAAQSLRQIKLEVHVLVKRCLTFKFYQKVYMAGCRASSLTNELKSAGDLTPN
jgi:hypothetical protein